MISCIACWEEPRIKSCVLTFSFILHITSDCDHSHSSFIYCVQNQASVSNLNDKLDETKKRPRKDRISASQLKELIAPFLSKHRDTQEETEKDIDKLEKIRKARGARGRGERRRKDPGEMDPEELHKELWTVLSVRDSSTFSSLPHLLAR